MAESDSGLKNSANVPFVDNESTDFFSQRKIPVDDPHHFYQKKLRVGRTPLPHYVYGNRRGSQYPVKKVQFQPKLFPYGQLFTVSRPYELRRDSGDSEYVLKDQGDVIYYSADTFPELIGLPPRYHHLFKFWSEDGFANYHPFKPTWHSLELLYGHRLNPEKHLLLHELKTREEKLRWLYMRCEEQVDHTPSVGYLELMLGHLLQELDRHILIAKAEKEKEDAA